MRAEPMCTRPAELRATMVADVTYTAQSISKLQIYKQAQPTI